MKNSYIINLNNMPLMGLFVRTVMIAMEREDTCVERPQQVAVVLLRISYSPSYRYQTILLLVFENNHLQFQVHNSCDKIQTLCVWLLILVDIYPELLSSLDFSLNIISGVYGEKNCINLCISYHDE